eukprot:COSAG02_NODE_51551_length_313_cov_0.962617_1_plen_24_part_01
MRHVNPTGEWTAQMEAGVQPDWEG